MSLITVGGIPMQWPIGMLSDRFDRRRVLAYVTILASLVALLAISVCKLSTNPLLVLMGLFGGVSLPLYPLCIAHTNDHLASKQMVSASASWSSSAAWSPVWGPLPRAY